MDHTQGHKRLFISAGTLLATVGLITAATFTDFANLNIGDGTSGNGIAGNNRFNIQVVGTDANGVPQPGTWQEANSANGIEIAVPKADILTPGDTASVDIPYRNESPKLKAAITFNLQDKAGKTSDPDLLAALRFTITNEAKNTKTTLVKADATFQDLSAALALGTFDPNEEGVLHVIINLPDQGTPLKNNALNGKSAFTQVHFDATSVQP
ncbi:MAG: hypothetical protein LBR21_09250 [Propionibacteriaceae bacterium]|jgi:hypothetical protein|nr:hypothetical protein [Propionibacteriaceae bacterium]